jgi:hypothetical protein
MCTGAVHVRVLALGDAVVERADAALLDWRRPLPLDMTGLALLLLLCSGWWREGEGLLDPDGGSTCSSVVSIVRREGPRDRTRGGRFVFAFGVRRLLLLRGVAVLPQSRG